MAMFKTLAAFLCLAVVLHFVESHQQMENNDVADTTSLEQKIDCGAACAVRCQLSSRPHLCLRACGTCCARCNCVPPGTYGHYEACPCYANMTTHGGQHKCP